MIGKLAAMDSRSSRQFKPQIYQSKGRGQNRGNYERCSMTSEIIKTDIGQIVETEGSIGKIEVDQDMGRIIEVKILEVTQEHIKILKDRVVEESTEITIGMKVTEEIGIATGLEIDQSLETLIIEEMIGV